MKDKCKWVCERSSEFLSNFSGDLSVDSFCCKTECGGSYIKIIELWNREFIYCPYCGKLIEFEED